MSKSVFESTLGACFDRVIAGTGSRTARWQDVAEPLAQFLQARTDGAESVAVLSGGALGFDRYLARVAYQFELPFYLSLPSPDYGPYYWKDEFAAFERMCSLAAGVEYVCSWHHRGRANLLRNERMVALADEFVVYDAGSSGTKHCLGLIRRAKVPYTLLDLGAQEVTDVR